MKEIYNHTSKRMRLISLLLIIAISSKSQTNNLYEINPPAFIANKIVLSEIADDINYVPLDNSFPLGRILNIKKVNNSFYTSVQNVGLLVFNKDGKLVRKIANIGRGPGEYIVYLYFTIDANKGDIYVMDNNTIKTYSKDGNFIRNIPLEEYGGYFRGIEFLNSKLLASEFIVIGKAKYNWIILDTLGNLMSEKLNLIPTFKTRMAGIGGTYSFNNKIGYWDLFNDTIFTVSDDCSYKTSYVFSHGEYRMPRALDNKMELRLIPLSLFESSSFIIYQYTYNEELKVAFIDKVSKKSYLSDINTDDSCDMENDLDGGIMCRPLCFYEENGREFLLGYIHPNKLKTHITSNKFKNSVPVLKSKKQELEGLANSLNETDNPILMILRLNK
ncbi:MAG TPA: 6-bladed beta-propeller [Candidatus Cloacimonadota bacterium]|jgi:hypothetical protein|nr:6-bladed beta-propeller [Candidatus Cloacimonadota bacterium]